MPICEDCNGTGKYIGFNVIEPCKKCAGYGWNYDQPPEEPEEDNDDPYIN